MSTGEREAGEQRVQEAVRRHARTRAFAEAENVFSAVLSDPGCGRHGSGWRRRRRSWAWSWKAASSRSRTATTTLWRKGDADGLAGLCAGKHGRWGRICVLPEGHETSMEEPH
ncbi:hypothetical protein [Streptomyces griseus]|uniref:hypothetical protein n=1 Tax=Streptomyces griseus TaxID=1911 RepID=UPI001F487F98|nr:hypothetical protein [Streptomyces griseus]